MTSWSWWGGATSSPTGGVATRWAPIWATASPFRRTGSRDTRYPRVTLEEVERRRPELVLLPDEPHEFTERDAEVFRALDIPAAPDGVRFCDGKDLMWYGLRALEGASRLSALLGRELCY